MRSYADHLEVKHNQAASRFEIRLEDQRAVLDYQRRGATLVLTHTGVPPAFEGRGVGSALVRAGLEYARAHGLTVVPTCSFVAAYVRRHPEYQDVAPTRTYANQM